MKAKKILALVLALCLLCAVTACGGDGNSSTSSTSGTSSTSSESGETSDTGETSDVAEDGNGEVYRVRLTVPTLMTPPSEEGVQQVEDAINEYLRNDLGITQWEMDLEILGVADYSTNISMALASGEKYDVFAANFYASDLSTYVSNGYLSDLSSYVDNELADAVSVLPENWLRLGTVNGKVYAIPAYTGKVLSYKYVYNKELYGDVVDWSTVDSLDDLDAVLPELKAAHPEEYPLVDATAPFTLMQNEGHVSPVGTYAATVGDSTELVNLFATDAF